MTFGFRSLNSEWKSVFDAIFVTVKISSHNEIAVQNRDVMYFLQR